MYFLQSAQYFIELDHVHFERKKIYLCLIFFTSFSIFILNMSIIIECMYLYIDQQSDVSTKDQFIRTNGALLLVRLYTFLQFRMQKLELNNHSLLVLHTGPSSFILLLKIALTKLRLEYGNLNFLYIYKNFLSVNK